MTRDELYRLMRHTVACHALGAVVNLHHPEDIVNRAYEIAEEFMSRLGEDLEKVRL